MSVLDIEYNVYNDNTIIKRWLEENCDIYSNNVEPYTIIDNVVNVYGTVIITNKMIECIPIQFGEITEGFSCAECIHLKSLKGCPKQTNWFNCSRCESLTSLEGGPKITPNWYDCSECFLLETLKGGPIQCDNFICDSCPLLKDVNLKSSHIGSFDCSDCASLKTLNGLPDIINGNLRCCNCSSLEDMVGFPNVIKGSLNCYHCNKLSSINGIPEIITGDVLLNRCKVLNITEKEIRDKSIVKGTVYV